MLELSDRFEYDETSPTCLRWKIEIRSGKSGNKINVSPGDVAGGLSCTGYYQVRVDGKLKLVHRVIWELVNGEIPDGLLVDHRDQNKTNNKQSNLRLVTKAANNQNQKLRHDSTSGAVGVTKTVNTERNGKVSEYWRAVWVVDGKQKSKAFSVKRYGDAVAFELACQHRAQKIEELNLSGENYTELHGKERRNNDNQI